MSQRTGWGYTRRGLAGEHIAEARGIGIGVPLELRGQVLAWRRSYWDCSASAR